MKAYRVHQCFTLGALLAIALILEGGCSSTGAARHALADEENVSQSAVGTHSPDDLLFETDPFSQDPFFEETAAVPVDPWEPFNSKIFWFNLQFDWYLLKPAATGFDWILPDSAQKGIRNAFVNLSMPRRFFNNLFQQKYRGAGREMGRFLINTTLGVGGLLDVAKKGFGIEPSDEDTGQTMAVYGIDSGPYLVLPLLGPSTARDSVGLIFDTLLEPLTYISFIIPSYASSGAYTTQITNERSLNLETFESVEAVSLDLYIAVQDAYLQRRKNAIQE